MADGAPVGPTDVVNPAFQRKVGHDLEEVAKLTAQLAVISKLLPGPVGKIAAFAFAGVEKTHEGRVRPSGATLLNALPSPFGYMPPEDFGLKKNFYLPAGSSTYLPAILDRARVGVAEQRVEDLQRQNSLAENAVRSDLARARAAVAGESPATLDAILQGQGGFTRAGVVIATSGAGLASLQLAAAERLEALRPKQPPATRATTERPPIPPDLAALSAAVGVLALDLIGLLQSQNPPDP
jgi:hypothetical protein